MRSAICTISNPLYKVKIIIAVLTHTKVTNCTSNALLFTNGCMSVCSYTDRYSLDSIHSKRIAASRLWHRVYSRSFRVLNYSWFTHYIYGATKYCIGGRCSDQIHHTNEVLKSMNIHSTSLHYTC